MASEDTVKIVNPRTGEVTELPRPGDMTDEEWAKAKETETNLSLSIGPMKTLSAPSVGESMEFTLGDGTKVPIQKHDMSDEDWEAVKNAERLRAGMPTTPSEGDEDAGVPHARPSDGKLTYPGFPNAVLPESPDTTTPKGAAQAQAMQELSAEGLKYVPARMGDSPLQKPTGEFNEYDVMNRAKPPDASMAQPNPVAPGQVQMATPPVSPSGNPMPGMAPGGFGVSVKESGGVGLGPSHMAGMPKKINDTFQAHKTAVEKAAELEALRMAKGGELQQQAIDQRRSAAARETEMRQEADRELEKSRDAISSVHKKMAEIQKVDPGRVWNNMGTGGKILGGIAAAIGGIHQANMAILGVKVDNAALEMIKDAIKTDIQVQQMNIDNQREGLNAELGGAREMYQMLRDQGLTEIEAYRTEEALKYDLAIQQATLVAGQVGTEEAKAKAQALITGLQGERDKTMMQVYESLDNHAKARAQLSMQNRELALKAQLIAAKANGKGGELMRGPQIEGLAQGQTAYKTIDELQKDYGKVSGVINRFTALVPLASTDAKEFNAQKDLAIRHVAKFIDESVLQKHDIESWDQVFPKAGQMEIGQKKIDFIKQLLQESYEARVKGFQGSGYNVAPSFQHVTDQTESDLDF